MPNDLYRYIRKEEFGQAVEYGLATLTKVHFMPDRDAKNYISYKIPEFLHLPSRVNVQFKTMMNKPFDLATTKTKKPHQPRLEFRAEQCRALHGLIKSYF